VTAAVVILASAVMTVSGVSGYAAYKAIKLALKNGSLRAEIADADRERHNSEKQLQETANEFAAYRKRTEAQLSALVVDIEEELLSIARENMEKGNAGEFEDPCYVALVTDIFGRDINKGLGQRGSQFHVIAQEQREAYSQLVKGKTGRARAVAGASATMVGFQRLVELERFKRADAMKKARDAFNRFFHVGTEKFDGKFRKADRARIVKVIDTVILQFLGLVGLASGQAPDIDAEIEETPFLTSFQGRRKLEPGDRQAARPQRRQPGVAGILQGRP